MGKRIQIPRTLYEQMAGYILAHYDEDDAVRYGTILRGIREKSEAELRHSLYTIYKSEKEAELKEAARQAYLDHVGMRQSFRWQEGSDPLYCDIWETDPENVC